ncbi:MAG: AsmA family protein [Alphaproteobacteria bacterium]|nr:AsmA family protein [Alphaproteobacteria bacterium]
MIKKNKFFIVARIVFLFFAVLVVAIIVALSQMDMNTLRNNLLNVLRASTGMQVEILGDVSWKLSLRPRVTMHNVVIPNNGDAKHKNLFDAETVDVQINLISLFTNRPAIQRVGINNASIYLNDNIWNRKNGNTADSAVQQDLEKPEYPFEEPGLGALGISNLLVYMNGEKYVLPRMNIRYSDRSGAREYRGWINPKSTVIPFIISFDKYNAERKVYPVSVAFSSDGDALIANVALEGTSKIPIDFVITGDIPDIRPIGELLNMEFPKMPAVQVDISGGVGHKKLTLHKSSIVVRGGEIKLSGSLDWGKKKPELNINLASKKVNLMELFPELYGSSTKPKGRELNVFHDMPLFGKYLYQNQITASVELGKLIMYRNLSLDNLKVNLRARDAKLRVDAKTGFVDGNIVAAINGDVDVSGRIDAEMGGVGHGITIGTLLDQIKIKDFISDLPLDFETYVRASGRDMSEVMHTITGPVRVYSVGNGWAHSELVEYMYGEDFLTSLRHSIHDMFSSNKKYNQMTIKAATANLKLRDGLIETQNGVAIETNAINVMLDGTVDLGAETLSLSLTTIPVRGIKLSISGNVVNTITITGNLAEPDIQISGAAIAGKALSATGLGLLLAPFTGGVGLLAGAGVGLLAGDLLTNWLADDNPCKTALERGAPSHKNDPEWMDLSAAELANGVINSTKKSDSNK